MGKWKVDCKCAHPTLEHVNLLIEAEVAEFKRAAHSKFPKSPTCFCLIAIRSLFITADHPGDPRGDYQIAQSTPE